MKWNSEDFRVMELVGPTLQVAEIYAVVLVFHMIIPAQDTVGYCCKFNGIPLRYRLNALRVLIAVDLFYAILSLLGLKDPVYLASHFVGSWVGAGLLGVAVSICSYIHGKLSNPVDAKYLRCLTVDMVSMDPITAKPQIATLPILDPHHNKKHPVIDFYNGFVFNPQFLGVDLKMMLYSWGASLLHLNIFSLSLLATQKHGQMNVTLVYLVQFTIFLVEYCYFEHVHLYTYDLFSEKMGFKLLFGCLGFYPFMYCIGGISLALSEEVNDISVLWSAISFVIYLVGWSLTRGANLQKFYFKTNPSKKTVLFFIPQRTVGESRLLMSGFWGLSRHINYFGEILQAVGLAIPCTLAISGVWRFVPLIYPLYYILLFVAREREDNDICRRKYGDVWETYCALVPYRIVPFIY